MLDSITISANTSGGTIITQNGTIVEAAATSSLLSLKITGDTAGSLTVDYSNGDPLPPVGLFADSPRINITGGTGADTMLNTASTVIFQNALVADSEIRHPAGSAVTFLNAGSGDTVAAVAGTVTVAGDLTNNGAGSSNGGPTIIVNTAATVLFTGTQHLSALDILPGGTARMAHSGTDVLVTGSLAISSATSNLAGGLLDLADNDLIVRSGNATNIAGLLANGYDMGWWDNAHAISGYITPAGIDSTIALSDPSAFEALGYAQIGSVQGDLPAGLFDRQSISTGDVIVKFTYYGDANLDGSVDSADQALINNGIANHLTGWTNGDFFYQGSVSNADVGPWSTISAMPLPESIATLVAGLNFPVSRLPKQTPTGVAISSWMANWGNGAMQTFLPTAPVVNPYLGMTGSFLATLTPLDVNGDPLYRYPHVNVTVVAGSSSQEGPDAPPWAPGNVLTAAPVSSTQVIVGWNWPTAETGAEGFEVAARDLSSTGSSYKVVGAALPNNTSASQSALISGLTPNDNYSFELYGFDSSGSQLYAATATQTMPAPLGLSRTVSNPNNGPLSYSYVASSTLQNAIYSWQGNAGGVPVSFPSVIGNSLVTATALTSLTVTVTAAAGSEYSNAFDSVSYYAQAPTIAVTGGAGNDPFIVSCSAGQYNITGSVSPIPAFL